MCKYGPQSGQLDQLGPAQEKILSFIQPGSKVLELGCATGYMTKVLKERLDCKVTAVEIDAKALKKASLYSQRSYTGDLNDVKSIDLPKDQYDFIIFADVLEHLSRPEEVLREIKQWLKPGGKILVSLPNIAFWEIRKDLLLGRFDYTDLGILDETHLHFYTDRGSRKLIQGSGLSVDSLSYIPAYFPLDNLFRWKTRLLKKPVDGLLMALLPRLFAYQLVVSASAETK